MASYPVLLDIRRHLGNSQIPEDWIYSVVLKARSYVKRMSKDDASRFIAAFRDGFGDDADALLDDRLFDALGESAGEAVIEAWNAVYG